VFKRPWDGETGDYDIRSMPGKPSIKSLFVYDGKGSGQTLMRLTILLGEQKRRMSATPEFFHNRSDHIARSDVPHEGQYGECFQRNLLLSVENKNSRYPGYLRLF